MCAYKENRLRSAANAKEVYMKQKNKKRAYSELTEAEKEALDEKLAAIPKPKITVEIETGIFAPFVWLLSRLGLCRMKEKYQAAHPEYNVRYDYEV
jgi:hypothetical protein